MDQSELRVRPQAEDGARLRRAQLARRTLGISPASLMLPYADWLAHFVIAPPVMGAREKGFRPLGSAPGTHVLGR